MPKKNKNYWDQSPGDIELVEVTEFNAKGKPILHVASDILRLIAGKLDFDSRANFEISNKFIYSSLSHDPLWHNIINNEITDTPTLAEKETYKSFYGKAYILRCEIKKALKNQNTPVGIFIKLFSKVIKQGTEKLTELLIAKVPLNDVLDSKNAYNTFLHEAVLYDRPEIVKQLLAKKVLVDPVGAGWHQAGEVSSWIPGTGDTPLMLAASKGLHDCLVLLIGAGANVNNINRQNGKSALHYATKKGHLDCVKELVSHGAELNKKNRSGYQPIQVARCCENIECEEYLRKAMEENKLPIPKEKTFLEKANESFMQSLQNYCPAHMY